MSHLARRSPSIHVDSRIHVNGDRPFPSNVTGRLNISRAARRVAERHARNVPLIVLTRERGGYGDDLDLPAAALERNRLDAQRALADLSSAGTQRIIASGHSMHLEAPEAVAQAIRDVTAAARSHQRSTKRLHEHHPQATIVASPPRAISTSGTPVGRSPVPAGTT